MYIHIIDFAYYLKNDPDTELEGKLIAPVGSSSEARLYFWECIHKQDDLPWSEVDCIYITLVRSKYIDVDTEISDA
jgi:hypothetical protein